MSDKGQNISASSCIISEEVIASIASTAALEVPGVISMSTKPTDIKGIVSSAASKTSKSINNESETSINVYVNLEAGVRIPDVAFEIQKSVKSAVQAMTSKPINKVNVFVEGIVFENAKK